MAQIEYNHKATVFSTLKFYFQQSL